MEILDEEGTVEKLAERYFSFGFQHKEILAFLRVLHQKKISLRTLKRTLFRLRLYRRKYYSNLDDTIRFIEMELNKSGQLHGYRWMHLRCLQNNIVVSQEVVRILLKLLDSEGVEIRKRKRLRRRQYYNKGPNYLWHFDSYDKLKPFGICINGCIDGFSRHIIWLRAGLTSSDPKVIGGYFLDALKEIGGCPKTVRCDMGTENGVVERIQKTLHELFNEEQTTRPCFIYGESTHNQRIEAWWSILRKHSSQFWIDLFGMLKDENLFDGSFLDKSLIQFCFRNIIQQELNQVAMEWNVHRIKKSRNAIAPTGRPAIMYEMPSLYDASNYLVKVPNFYLDTLSAECKFYSVSCDQDFYDLTNLLMVENSYSHVNDPYAAVELYTNLRKILLPLLCS